MKWLLLSKGHKPDNFESHNVLKLNSTNIWGLCSIFFEFESFLQPNSFDIPILCEKKLDDSIDSGNFSVRGYLPLIRKILLLIGMTLQFMWRKNFFHGTYL